MFKLSPSDFAFLWEQCKRCFWLKVIHNIRQPSMPMAGIFKKIEGLQMNLYNNKRTEEFLPGLPPGTIRCGEKFVESDPIAFNGTSSICFIAGKIDSLIEFDDGSWGILDFKTTETSPEKAELYSRQLHAYARCFENPAKSPQTLRTEAPKLSPITKLGILCFEPSLITLNEGRHTYQGEVKWIEIPYDKAKFLSFVEDTMKLLSSPIPAPTPDCNWCKYAERMSRGNFGNTISNASAENVTCPNCGASMVKRTRRSDGAEFWGCTKYPECKGTRKV